MRDEGVNIARAQFYKNGGQQPDWTGPDRVPDGIPDPYFADADLQSYTREFIIQNSWTTTFLGGYTVYIENNGDGTATFTVKNTSGFTSLTHYPFTDYSQPTFESAVRDFVTALPHIRLRLPNYTPSAILNNRFRWQPGPGGNMYQEYVWVEPIPAWVLNQK